MNKETIYVAVYIETDRIIASIDKTTIAGITGISTASITRNVDRKTKPYLFKGWKLYSVTLIHSKRGRNNFK